MNFIHYKDFVKTDHEIGDVVKLIAKGCILLRKNIWAPFCFPPILNRASFNIEKFGEGVEGLRKYFGHMMYTRYFDLNKNTIQLDTFMVYQLGGINGNEQFYATIATDSQDELDKWKIAYKSVLKLKAFI